jgi:SAM-dependent methyltransferase
MAALAEPLLARWLLSYYRLQKFRDWTLAPALGRQPPHFFDHRGEFLEFALGERPLNPAVFSRAFFSSELVHPGDRILDIGCGAGFFSMRFFAAVAGHIDAIDIEPTAVAAGRRWNAAPNVSYWQLDAVNDPFPSDGYDMIVWDGAIGHFPREVTQQVLAKVAKALEPEGTFVGSESLGCEGHDHLQFFDGLAELRNVLAPHFRHVRLRERSFLINEGRFNRREGYWRCSNSEARLAVTDWA